MALLSDNTVQQPKPQAISQGAPGLVGQGNSLSQPIKAVASAVGQNTSQFPMGFNAPNLAQSQGPQMTNSLPGASLFTPTGGALVPKQVAKTALTAQPHVDTATPQPFSSYINNTIQTPGGGKITASQADGVSNYTPAQSFSIANNPHVPQDSLTGNNSMNDVMKAHSTYQDLFNALSQSQGYNQNYIGALNRQYGAQAQGAQLSLNQTGINSALVSKLAPTTQDYINNPNAYNAGGVTSQAQALNGQEQAINAMAQGANSVQQLAANQALNTQQLARTGQIASAQTQLQYNPASITAQNALQQANSYATNHLDAGILPYNLTGMTPEQYQQYAAQKAQQSGSFQAGYLNQYSTPGGGTGLYNKLNAANSMTQNSDGSLSLVSGAAATLGDSARSQFSDLQTQYNNVAVPATAADKDYSLIEGMMKSASINDNSVPIFNAIGNAVNSKVLSPGSQQAFRDAVSRLNLNYAKIAGDQSGSVAGVNQSAEELNPDTLNASQLEEVHSALSSSANNLMNSTHSQMQAMLQQTGGQQQAPTVSAGNQQTYGSSWNF